MLENTDFRKRFNKLVWNVYLENAEILVPKGIRNKGYGTKKRMISASEKGSTSSTNNSRMCTGCNQYINHNWRTCPIRIAREER